MSNSRFFWLLFVTPKGPKSNGYTFPCTILWTKSGQKRQNKCLSDWKLYLIFHRSKYKPPLLEQQSIWKWRFFFSMLFCEKDHLIIKVCIDFPKALVTAAQLSGAQSARSFCLSASASGAQKFSNERERERTQNLLSASAN